MSSLHESRVDAVTVHRSGAVVTRLATLDDAADGVIRLGPLPMDIDDASVRVAVGSDAGVEATDLRVVLVAPPPDETLAPARPEDLLAAEREVKRLKEAIDAVREEGQRIASLGAVARPSGEPGAEPPPSPAEARVALLSLRDARLTEADARLRALEETLREAQRTLADLRERERRASNARRTEPDELRKAVEVRLRGEGPATLRLEYRVDAARWAPTYALRIDAAMERATLEVRAMVAQRSGEDWGGVSLSLSTASLSAWSELPELMSLRIGRQQPRPAKSGWRPPPTGADLLFGDLDRARQAIEAADRTPAPQEEPEPVVQRAPASEMRAGGRLDAGAYTQTGVLRAELQALEEDADDMPLPPPEAPKMEVAPGPPAAFAPQAAMRFDDELMMPVARKSAGAIGAMFGGAADAVGALASALVPEDGGSATLALDAPEEPVDQALLDYGRLRMPAPNAPSRGKLVLTSRRALYVEQIESLAIEVDVGAAIAAGEGAPAERPPSLAPSGCEPPEPAGFDYVYRAGGRLDAPSDGAFHNLGLTADEGEARARFVVVPRESRDAFRFVELDNPLDAPLLPGPVDVFVGGDFLMTSRLEEVPEGGVLRLGLGVEQRLKVSRNARFSEKSGGLMGGKLDLLHAVEVELENHLPREALVEVRERLPTIADDEDDIKIEEGAVDPPWEVWEPDEQPELAGGRRWRLTIPPSEKRTLSAAYAIRIASKHELVGGNRREQ